MIEIKLPTAQWIFERQMAWIAAADTKTAAIVAIDSAMIAALATAFASTKTPATWAVLLSIIALISIVIGIICCAAALLPRTEGPKNSLLFFGTISKVEPAEYLEALAAASEKSFLEDLAAQIHRNAEIACLKHIWVRRALGWSFFSAIPWVFAIALLVRP
jgi:Family of unknown function (DUF5706)